MKNGGMELSPFVASLTGKDKSDISLSEEMDITLKGGLIEIASTDTIIGGAWTNKGYLSISPVLEQH